MPSIPVKVSRERWLVHANGAPLITLWHAKPTGNTTAAVADRDICEGKLRSEKGRVEMRAAEMIAKGCGVGGGGVAPFKDVVFTERRTGGDGRE